MSKEKIILDVDPGHDDAIAILLAAGSEAIDLRGITVVAGNQTLPKTLKNALKVCDFAGIKDVPILAGMDGPILREQVTGREVHGESGLGGPEIPEPELVPEDTHAVDFLVEECLKSEGDLILTPTGPLTNIAIALRKELKIKEKVKEIILMGGACGAGNVTASAEFNIFADPEAARIVFECGLPITMVGLDLTRQARAGPEVIERIGNIGNNISDLVVELLEFVSSTYKNSFGIEGPLLHDPCTVAKVIDRDVFSTEKMRVDVETKGEHTYGRTVCDLYDRTHKKKNVEVATKLNSEKFWDILIEALRNY